MGRPSMASLQAAGVAKIAMNDESRRSRETVIAYKGKERPRPAHPTLPRPPFGPGPVPGVESI